MQKKYNQLSYEFIFEITKKTKKKYTFFVISKKNVYAYYFSKLIKQITKQNHRFLPILGHFCVFSRKMKKKKMLCIHQIENKTFPDHLKNAFFF